MNRISKRIKKDKIKNLYRKAEDIQLYTYDKLNEQAKQKAFDNSWGAYEEETVMSAENIINRYIEKYFPTSEMYFIYDLTSSGGVNFYGYISFEDIQKILNKKFTSLELDMLRGANYEDNIKIGSSSNSCHFDTYDISLDYEADKDEIEYLSGVEYEQKDIDKAEQHLWDLEDELRTKIKDICEDLYFKCKYPLENEKYYIEWLNRHLYDIKGNMKKYNGAY